MTGRHTEGTPYHYKHGWIPIDGTKPGHRSADIIAARAGVSSSSPTGERSADALAAKALGKSRTVTHNQLVDDYRNRVEPTPHEWDALRNYATLESGEINDVMRTGIDPWEPPTRRGEPEIRGDIEGLHSLLDRYTTPGRVIAYRGTREDLTDGITNTTGRVLTAPGFLSTSVGLRGQETKGIFTSFSEKGFQYRITVPEGTHAIVVNGAIPHHIPNNPIVTEANEVILPPDTRFRVMSDKTTSTGVRQLEVVAVPPAKRATIPMGRMSDEEDFIYPDHSTPGDISTSDAAMAVLTGHGVAAWREWVKVHS